MSSDRSVDELFALLSDETRVDILRAVAVAEHEREETGAGPAVLAFSDIYDRVDVDNTSKLSSHLGDLTGAYLRKNTGTRSPTRENASSGSSSRATTSSRRCSVLRPSRGRVCSVARRRSRRA
jgi:DNA-binding transcriptional ArsR family regulator